MVPHAMWWPLAPCSQWSLLLFYLLGILPPLLWSLRLLYQLGILLTTPVVLLILFMTPTVSLFTLSALFAKPRLDKA